MVLNVELEARKFCIQPMREQRNCSYAKLKDQAYSAKNSKVPTVNKKIMRLG